MTNAELKSLFNLLYNNVDNNAAPGLKDKEISSFLNKALNEIVKQHALGMHTNYQLGINQTSKRDVELDTLIKTYNYLYNIAANNINYHPKGKMFMLSSEAPDMLMILSENIIPAKLVETLGGHLPILQKGDILDVVELSYLLFNKFIAGVYKYPKKNQCWKIRHDSKAEIVFPVKIYLLYSEADFQQHFSYKVTYVEIPSKIDVSNETNQCVLPEVLHDEIVQRAVELAKAAYMNEGVNIQMSMGQRSE